VTRWLLVVAFLLAPSLARADDGASTHKLHWDPAWSHANGTDWGIAAVSLSVVTFELGVLQPIRPPAHWTQTNAFDEGIRDALRVKDSGTSSALATAAWALWGTQMAYPVVVDVPYAWRRYGWAAARDLFWQDAVTMLVAGAIDGFLRDAVGRVRPNVSDCYAKNGESCLDANSDTTRSFPGGHLVNSTAAAALLCTQHLYTRLYGGPWDAVACATTITASATITVFRVMSDDHWATDQIVGAALGSLLGWAIPYVMHFHGHALARTDEPPPSALVVPMPMTFPGGGGLGLGGVF